MLSIKTTVNNLGIAISGDYNDLNELYTALGNLAGYEGQIPAYDDVSIRILGICYDLRHAYMGNREIEMVDSGINEEIKKWRGELYLDYNLYYSVNILWIEAMFSVLALDDLINIATKKSLSKKYLKNDNLGLWIEDEKERKEHLDRVRLEREIRLPYDVSIARFYQASVWKALVDAVGIHRYRRIKKALSTDESTYYIRLKYQGFCTQYLDLLNIDYIDTNPKNRPTLLTSQIRSLIELDIDYYEVEHDIKKFASENNIKPADVTLTNLDYPDEFEW